MMEKIPQWLVPQKGGKALSDGVVGIDPLPLVPLENQHDSIESCEEIRSYVHQLRRQVRYVVGCGEEILLLSDSMEFAICCDDIEHSSNPNAVVREIHWILKPDGVMSPTRIHFLSWDLQNGIYGRGTLIKPKFW